ncbi:hypothetical protein ykris0001_38230 [Yersinia kristensenii ATCC 33638]|nr:hypothetical protein ykris0001_38230 [Yersinia kristensenii ATCC 33638]
MHKNNFSEGENYFFYEQMANSKKNLKKTFLFYLVINLYT